MRLSKNKVKLLLVEDYIELNKISITCEKSSKNGLNVQEENLLRQIIALKNELLEIYEKIFFRFGLMDISYLLLKDGLKNKQEEQVKIFDILNVEQLLFKLKMMVKTLAVKMKKLSLNDIEMKYIVQNLSV